MKSWLRERPMTAFFILSLVYGALLFIAIPAMLGARPDSIPGHVFRDFGYVTVLDIGPAIIEHPILIAFFGYGFSPSLAGLTVVAATSGWPGVRKMLLRLNPLGMRGGGRSAVAAYLLLIGGFAACTLALLGMHFAISSTAASPFSATSVSAVLWAFAIGLCLQPGGVLEEVTGWRGYANATLLEQGHQPLKVSVQVGLMWFAWHMIVPFSPFLVDLAAAFHGSFLTVELPVFALKMLISNVALSIVMTHLQLRVGLSTWPAIACHGLVNQLPFTLAIDLGGHAFASQKSLAFSVAMALLASVAAGIILLRYGRDLGAGRWPVPGPSRRVR